MIRKQIKPAIKEPSFELLVEARKRTAMMKPVPYGQRKHSFLIGTEHSNRISVPKICFFNIF